MTIALDHSLLDLFNNYNWQETHESKIDILPLDDDDLFFDEPSLVLSSMANPWLEHRKSFIPK